MERYILYYITVTDGNTQYSGYACYIEHGMCGIYGHTIQSVESMEYFNDNLNPPSFIEDSGIHLLVFEDQPQFIKLKLKY